MIEINNTLSAPVRKIKAKVELFNSSTLANTFNNTDALKSLTIERVGEGKFFGFGVCQKLNIHLIDKDRLIDISTANSFKTFFDDINNFPNFYVTEVHRDENTNELSITAYDAIYNATEHTVAELGLVAPYTVADVANACAGLMGLGVIIPEVSGFTLEFEEGANLEGTETIREVLNAIAEVTQTIYFINSKSELVFKRLADGVDLTIDKAGYIELESSGNRRLATIASVTELGDNYSASTLATGSTQYVRNNPFWELREDVTALVDEALAAVGGLTINQFTCSWRGNYALEVGDKIGIITKDNNTVYSYILDDIIEYDGSFKQTTKYSYEDNEAETASNPTNIGEAMKQTFAKVDKVNKQVDIVVSEVEGYSEQISSLQLTTDNISATVSNVNKDVGELANRVNATITSEELQLAVQTEIANGVDKVTTTTGFTFNEEGLTVTKDGTEMTTQITEDGMSVYRDNDEVLTADNVGVKAENLHATTYLIIGEYSRLEDYSGGRTGCFWIGQ